MSYQISMDRTVTWQEFSALLAATGWGEHDETAFVRSYSAYPLVVHTRADDGALVGYVSAFSDGAFSTMLGELVVHPAVQGMGIGRALMQRVEQAFPGVPIYVKAMGPAKHFFCCMRLPGTEGRSDRDVQAATRRVVILRSARGAMKIPNRDGLTPSPLVGEGRGEGAVQARR